jgi:hypothetical protein
MKSPSPSLILGCLLAGVVGWWLPNAWQTSFSIAVSPPPAAVAVNAAPAPVWRWQNTLSQQRAMPLSTAERSWVLWVDQVPENEIETAIRALDPNYDLIPLRLLFSRWAKRDGPAALACFKSLHFPQTMHFAQESTGGLGSTSSFAEYPSRSVLDDLLRAWATTDPQATAAYAQELVKDSNINKNQLSEISFAAAELAKWKPAAESAATPPTDFVAAAAALSEQKSVKQQASGARALLQKWVGSDPAAALQWWSTVAPEVKQRFGTDWMEWPLEMAPAASALPVMMEHLLRSNSDLTDSISAMSKLGMNSFELNRHDQMGNNRLLQWTSYRLREWLAEAPESAVAWVDQQRNPQLKSYLVGQIGDQWTQQGKATEAIKLVQALPDTDMPTALRGLMQGWANTDAKAATQWLQKIEDPICRDECLATVIKQSGKSDPQWGLELALKISDPAIAKATIGSVTQWINHPKTVQSLIEAISQGDATKRNFLNQGKESSPMVDLDE